MVSEWRRLGMIRIYNYEERPCSPSISSFYKLVSGHRYRVLVGYHYSYIRRLRFYILN